MFVTAYNPGKAGRSTVSLMTVQDAPIWVQYPCSDGLPMSDNTVHGRAIDGLADPIRYHMEAQRCLRRERHPVVLHRGCAHRPARPGHRRFVPVPAG